MDGELKAVYEKFKHLDKLLSDESWLIGEDSDAGTLNRCINNCLFELWIAVKEHSTRPTPGMTAERVDKIFKTELPPNEPAWKVPVIVEMTPEEREAVVEAMAKAQYKHDLDRDSFDGQHEADKRLYMNTCRAALAALESKYEIRRKV